MSKEELRKEKRSEVSVVGDVSLELAEVKKLQKKGNEDSIHTITTGCGGLLTLICC